MDSPGFFNRVTLPVFFDLVFNRLKYINVRFIGQDNQIHNDIGDFFLHFPFLGRFGVTDPP